jgi:hypothetical protein
MTLLSAVKRIKKAEGLLVTPKVIDFLQRHPDGVVWDDEAYEVWRELTARAMGNDDRSGRFGASSRGDCLRLQVFNFLGMPAGKLLGPDTQNLFNDGKWRHLRWQMMALQAGAITHAEYPYAMKSLRVSGSMDGLNSYESFGFELKGDRNWSRVMDGVPEKHDLQMHTMMLATGWDTFVYIVEDKESQQWREIIVRRDPKIIALVRAELEELNEYIEDHRLPPVLPACAAKEGPYRSCDFARQCLDRHQSGDYFPDRPGDWDS